VIERAMVPPWPYPRIEARRAGGTDLTRGVAMLALCALGWTLCAIYFPEVFQGRRRGFSGPSIASMLVAGLAVVLGLAGIGSVLAGMSTRKTVAELTRTGTRCWGRIVSAAPASLGTELEIVVEPFVAHDDASTRDYREGVRVPERVTIAWAIDESRRSSVQPHSWCAFLLDPADPTRVVLDGFATPEGAFTALSDKPR